LVPGKVFVEMKPTCKAKEKKRGAISMFVTVLLQDTIQVQPWRFGQELEAITFALNKKYGDKVFEFSFFALLLPFS
jgi:hypothetical protein